MKVFTVDEPVFKTEPLFVLGCTQDELRAYFYRRGWRVEVADADGAAGQMLTFNREPWRVVWTRKLDRPVVLHELFHLVTRICADRGIAIRAHDERGDCGDETAAYLFEHFARAVLKRLR